MYGTPGQHRATPIEVPDVRIGVLYFHQSLIATGDEVEVHDDEFIIALKPMSLHPACGRQKNLGSEVDAL